MLTFVNRLGYGEVDFQIGGVGGFRGEPPVGGFPPKLKKLRFWGEILKKANMTDKIDAKKSRTEERIHKIIAKHVISRHMHLF